MANSNYYYNLYKQNKDKTNNLNRDINDLEKILYSLTYEIEDEINRANNEISNLQEDLRKCVRHNSSFNNLTNDMYNRRESAIHCDFKLNIASSEIQEEINNLSCNKNSSQANQDYYYNKYKEVKKEEFNEFINNIF